MPGAVANWLQGEREFRRSRYASALALLSRAVAQDSSFALPAVRGAEAADWLGAHQEASRLVEVARRSGAGLPAKYADYAAGLDAYLRGEADTAVIAYRSALALDSAWAPAWMALGETYFHLLPSAGDPDSVAEDAFRRAQRFDPSLAPPLYHLFDLALFRGDVSAADSLYSAYRGFGPDSSWATETRLRLTCVRNPAKVDWNAEVQEHPIEVVSAAKLLLSNPRFWPCSDAAFRSARVSPNAAARWGGVFGRSSLLLAQQRRREAEAELDSAVAGGLRGAMALYVIAAAGGFGMEAKAATAMSALPAELEKLDAPALWFAGIWAFHAGDTVRLRSYTERLENLAAASPADRTLAGIADAVGARLALARLDTAGAISRLQRVRSTVPSQTLWWGIREPYSLERLLLVRLLMARGRLDEALAAVQSLGHHGPVLFLPLLPESLELHAELSARLGRPDVKRYRMAMASLRQASPEVRN
jgi:tetratricopeptide (TPR) repeat protein